MYEKQTFTSGQILKADHLNHIEAGIAKVYKKVNDLHVEDEGYKLRLAKIQYTSFEDGYWGNTPEEKAQNIAKYDIHVSGGINATTLPIIERARQLNPNLKICGYISVASGRPGPDGVYTFREGAVWDTAYANQFSNLTIPFTKWDILQQIEEFAHVGGNKTGEKLFIETYSWTDDSGAKRTEDKYIDLWTGGVSYDGMFWDDVGFDFTITEGSFFNTDRGSTIDTIKRQGFNNRREKYIIINSFAHERGMFVIPNSMSENDLYNPAVSAENPEGLPCSLTDQDYVFVESCFSMVSVSDFSNAVVWRNEIPRVVEYMQKWYPRVGAKVIVEDYAYPTMKKDDLQTFVTYAMATCAAAGIHYYSLTNTDNSLYVPEIFQMYVPDNRSENHSLYDVNANTYKCSFAENSISTERIMTYTTGDVISYGLEHGTAVYVNGRRIRNAFTQASDADYKLANEIKDMNTRIDQALADSKDNSSVYTRLMVDDWVVDELKYTQLITTREFETWGSSSVERYANSDAVNVTYDTATRSMSWTLDGSESAQSTMLSVSIDPTHFGHTIEMGYKIEFAPSNKGAYLNSFIDGSGWQFHGVDQSTGVSTLYPDRSDMVVFRTQLLDYDDSKNEIVFTFQATWNAGFTSTALKDFYLIDVDEYDGDVVKTEYTNHLPAARTAIGYSDYNFVITDTGKASFKVSFDSASKPFINYNGPYWGFDAKSILTPGHTYEIGIKDIVVNGFDDYASNDIGSCGFYFGLGTDNGTMIGDIPIKTKALSKVWPVKTYNKRFTVPEDVVFTGSSLYIRYQSYDGTGKHLENDVLVDDWFEVKDWYLFDIDENVIVRGVSPASTNLRICRVTDETFASDVENGTLVNNALYFTNTGKIYMTDVNRVVITVLE